MIARLFERNSSTGRTASVARINNHRKWKEGRRMSHDQLNSARGLTAGAITSMENLTPTTESAARILGRNHHRRPARRRKPSPPPVVNVFVVGSGRNVPDVGKA